MMNIHDFLTSEGYNDPIELLEDIGVDGESPAICRNPDCFAVEYWEPDGHGACPVCDAEMKSVLLILGVM